MQSAKADTAIMNQMHDNVNGEKVGHYEIIHGCRKLKTESGNKKNESLGVEVSRGEHRRY